MLSGYLETSRGDPRSQVSHLLQRRLSFCSSSEREQQRRRELRQEEEEEEAAPDERHQRRRREQESLFLHRRGECLSDGEEDSFLRNYGRGGGAEQHLMRSPSHSPPLNDPEDTDDVVPRVAAGNLHLSDFVQLAGKGDKTSSSITLEPG